MHNDQVGKVTETRGRQEVEIPVDAYFTAWQDNKPVHILSSFQTHRSEVTRRVEGPPGVWTQRIFQIASIIKLYN